MPGDIVAGSIRLIRLARFRPHIQRFFGQAIDGLHVSLAGLSQANLAEIENRNLKINLNSAPLCR
jgi:hypothetical protein